MSDHSPDSSSPASASSQESTGPAVQVLVSARLVLRVTFRVSGSVRASHCSVMVRGLLLPSRVTISVVAVISLYGSGRVVQTSARTGSASPRVVSVLLQSHWAVLLQ